MLIKEAPKCLFYSGFGPWALLSKHHEEIVQKLAPKMTLQETEDRRRKLVCPEGPTIKRNQSRSNFSISIEFLNSLEYFNLDVSNSPQKIGPRWVAGSKISFSLEIFNLARNLEFFWSLGPLGSLGLETRKCTKNARLRSALFSLLLMPHY